VEISGSEGETLAAQLRRLHSVEKLPLILLISLSANCHQNKKQYEELDLLSFLTKPIKPSQLHDTLLAALGDVKALKESSTKEPKLDADLAKRLPLRILLAEDNVVNQKVALKILEKLGYRADVAGNGVEVIEAIQRQMYDLVFMDVQMPEMDGLEATRHICEKWGDMRPRIIAMTANATRGDRDECLEAGMDGYVSKPVRVEELRAVLELWGVKKMKA
jgi:CheY-like chemotaxis protein